MDLSRYSTTVRDLLADARLGALGPGIPNDAARAKLDDLTIASLLAPEKARQPDAAQACLAGLWLYHDFLDESHTLSSWIHTPEGSYWHGIMHRREPDASNAAYWFRRVGDHPIFPALAHEAQRLGYPGRPDRWDPFQFIDRCEQYRDSGAPEEDMLRRVQLREWELLFDWCYRQAVSGS
jgi:hypothetical protein